jgi:hypothetical protein
MRCQTPVLILTAALLLVMGCRGLVNRTPGLLATGVSASRGGSGTPCQLTGNSMPREQCFDAVTGRPIPCPPQDATTILPGGAYPSTLPSTPSLQPSPPNELPFPGPNDMIPRQGIPYAPPSVAPGDGLGAATKTGQPLKTGQNK